MIKAVILDYGGTLANSNVPLDTTFEKAVERLLIEGIEVSALDFKNAFMDTVEWRRTIQEKGKEVDRASRTHREQGEDGQEGRGRPPAPRRTHLRDV